MGASTLATSGLKSPRLSLIPRHRRKLALVLKGEIALFEIRHPARLITCAYRRIDFLRRITSFTSQFATSRYFHFPLPIADDN